MESALGQLMKDPEAKRGKNALAVQNFMKAAHRSRTTPPLFGMTYTLRSLAPIEEDIANGLVTGSTTQQMGQLVRKAFITVSLTHIGDNPIEEEFAFPDLTPDQKKYLDNKPIEDDWRRRQVFKWLNEDTQVELADALFEEYLVLRLEVRKALGDIRPLSTSTLSGPSSLT